YRNDCFRSSTSPSNVMKFNEVARAQMHPVHFAFAKPSTDVHSSKCVLHLFLVIGVVVSVDVVDYGLSHSKIACSLPQPNTALHKPMSLLCGAVCPVRLPR